MEVAGWFVGPVMEKIIDVCFDYLEKKVRWQTNMKTELESLRKNHRTIQAAVLAANKAQISDQNHQINTWIWELRDALDEVNDVLDELEYMKHKEQLAKHMEETKPLGLDSYLWLLLLLDALCMLGRSFWSDNDEAEFLTPYGWPWLTFAILVVDSLVLLGQL